jgi:Rieske Fe-S protein
MHTMTESPFPAGVSRRTVLVGAAAIGAAGALAACGSASGHETTTQAGPVTVAASDVPVGGGKILGDSQVVVAQPAAGTFRAFSAVCTHQGCLVGSVANGMIICPCHGSIFSATDGSVRQGPAATPLTPKTVKVDGSTLTVS